MEVRIKFTYKRHHYSVEAPVDADKYSAIDLIDDCMKVLRKQQNIQVPSNPIFTYSHPKSKKKIEIGSDRQLMNMLALFEGKEFINIIVEEGLKKTELMLTYLNWLRDADKRDMSNVQDVVVQEVIYPNSPPQTQPSQPELPHLIAPVEQLPVLDQPIQSQHTNQPTTGTNDKKCKKKRRPRGLNLSCGSISNQLQLPVQINENVLSQSSNSVHTASLSSPRVASNHNSELENVVVDTRISGNYDLQIVPAVNVKTSNLQSEGNNEEHNEDQNPYYSDDSWDKKSDNDEDLGSPDESEQDYVHFDDDDEDIEELQSLRNGGDFSGDEDEGVLGEEKFLKDGVQFELQLDGAIKLEPRQIFMNKRIFREVMEDYAVQEGIDLHRVANDPWKYTVLCNNLDTCQWRLHASLLPDNVSFMIKTIKGEHTCSRLSENPAATSRWIMRKILPELRANNSMTPNAIRNSIHSKFGVIVNYMKCFRAKEHAMKLLQGNHAESYAKLHHYTKIASERNPGSIIDIKYQEYLNGPPTFSKLFICFNALKEGFLKGCRPFIGVDGCHLKGPYGGVLLSVVSIDGNNGIFPVAFAIVASESIDTWTYFFSNLRLIADEDVRKNWVIISDRQKGVEPALDAVMPEVTRRICCRHLYANFKKDHPGALLRNLFWEAAQCYTEVGLKDVLKKIEETDLGAFRYLREVDYNLWVRFHMPEHVKVIETTSNFVESFNSKLTAIRGSPIFSLLESLRRTLMRKLNDRRELISKMGGRITPYAKKILYRNTNAGCRCGHTASRDIEFEVTDSNRHYIVNLRDKHCDCMAWDQSGIPCKHACSILNWKRMDKDLFVDPYFSMSKYAATYTHAIAPIPDPSLWPESDSLRILSPPFLRKLPGRPKKHRRREEGEARPIAKRSSHVTCGKCKQRGHNSRTCSSQVVRGKGQGDGLVAVAPNEDGNGSTQGRTVQLRGKKKRGSTSADGSSRVNKNKKHKSRPGA